MPNTERIRYDYFVEIDDVNLDKHEYLNDIFELVKIVKPYMINVTSSTLNRVILAAEDHIYKWRSPDKLVNITIWRSQKLTAEEIADLLLSTDPTKQKKGIKYLEINPGLRRRVTGITTEANVARVPKTVEEIAFSKKASKHFRAGEKGKISENDTTSGRKKGIKNKPKE